MAVPKYNEFFPAFLNCLSDGAAHTLREIREYCADSFSLSREDRSATLESGRNVLKDRVGWARTHLKKAGLIESPERATFVITESGKDVLKRGTDILTLEFIHDLQVDRGEISPSPTPETVVQETQSPQETIENAIAELRSALADELLSELISMDDYDFEKVVVDLLIRMGYGSPEQNKDAVTQKSNDGGIDGIVKADRFGFDAVYTQAKKWKSESHIGRPDIQKFLGAMAGQGATKGLFITTGQFSSGAKDFVEKQLNHKIVLVDGSELAELMIEFGLGVTTVETYEIKRIDSDYFNSDN